MRSSIFTISLSALALANQSSDAAFTLTLSSADITPGAGFNTISFFEVTINVDAPVVAGQTYSDPAIISVDYRVNGILSSPTPSGFPAFGLIRSMTGTEFYGLSPESGLDFSISPTANLSDGLQLSELAGTGTVLTFNAREFDQSPGRYHPPIITLDSDGTGLLVNADNQSIFPNPPPPTGSGLLVDVIVGEEYSNPLTFDTNLTLTPAPEPTSASLLALASASLLLRRRKTPLS